MNIRVLYGKPKMKFPIGSWLIRWIEGTKGSHVALQIELSEVFAVFDSVPPMSRIVTQYRWDRHYETICGWKFEIQASESDVISWVLDNTDKRYSRLQCILLGLGDLCGGWVQKLVRKQNPNGSEYLICVEAVARFLMRFDGQRFEQGPDVIGLKDFLAAMDERVKSRK